MLVIMFSQQLDYRKDFAKYLFSRHFLNTQLFSPFLRLLQSLSARTCSYAAQTKQRHLLCTLQATLKRIPHRTEQWPRSLTCTARAVVSTWDDEVAQECVTNSASGLGCGNRKLAANAAKTCTMIGTVWTSFIYPSFIFKWRIFCC